MFVFNHVTTITKNSRVKKFCERYHFELSLVTFFRNAWYFYDFCIISNVNSLQIVANQINSNAVLDFSRLH